MKKKQVELTQEQCQEIIDQMTTRSFYRSDKGNSSDMENLQTMESVGSSIDDILPEPLLEKPRDFDPFGQTGLPPLATI